MLSVGQVDVLLTLLIGFLAICNTVMPNGSWKSISLIMGVGTLIRALLKWNTLPLQP